jgi:tetratricopeptide (TPR) repeat protein
MFRIYVFLLMLATAAQALPAQSINRLMKRAAELEQERNYRDAVNVYNEILFRNSGHTQARSGLQRSAQFVLDDMLSLFWREYNLENFEQAIREYQNAQSFERRLAVQQVRLEWPSHYVQYFRQAREGHAKKLFMEAAKAVDSRNYAQATRLIRDMQQFDPEHPGIAQLQLAIEIDPIYNQAVEALRGNRIGEAISLLNQVSERAPDYRDTRELIQQLRNKSQLRVAVLPIEDLSRSPNLSREISSHIVNQILALRNPLIHLIDREHMERILSEQKLGLSGLIDERTAVNAGRLMGGSTVLIGTITDFNVVEEGPQRERKTAFIRERNFFRDAWTGMQMSNFAFRETNYTEIKEEIRVTITFKYRLIAVETGRILDSDVITRSVINTTRYATYTGDPETLFPTTGNISQAELQRWRQRFQTTREVKALQELVSIVQEDVAKEVATKINRNGFAGL